MNSHRQEAPFAVQIELTEGCNLYCDFCGLQGIRGPTDKTFKFMSLPIAKRIAFQLSYERWNPRVEFAMHGEPTLNPHMIEIVRIFREFLPKAQLMMTSNGGGLLGGAGPINKLTALFDAGLNIFAFDAYEYVKIKDKLDELIFSDSGAMLNDLPFEARCYPDEPDYSPHTRYGHDKHLFIRVQDISKAEKGTHSSLNNHCGAGSEGLKEPIKARCAKPFRELAIRWNGDVAICCNDWRGVYKIGNVLQHKTIEALWNSPPFRAARAYLYAGEREGLKPCNVCDAKSYRVGLLPDKFGKVKLAAPTKQDAVVVAEAAGGKSYTVAVVRPWEIRRRKP